MRKMGRLTVGDSIGIEVVAPVKIVWDALMAESPDRLTHCQQGTIVLEHTRPTLSSDPVMAMKLFSVFLSRTPSGYSDDLLAMKR